MTRPTTRRPVENSRRSFLNCRDNQVGFGPHSRCIGMIRSRGRIGLVARERPWDGLPDRRIASRENAQSSRPGATAAILPVPQIMRFAVVALPTCVVGDSQKEPAQEVRGAHCEIVHGSGPFPRPRQAIARATSAVRRAVELDRRCALCALVLAGRLRPWFSSAGLAIPCGFSVTQGRWVSRR
jgi:hypothetical protein